MQFLVSHLRIFIEGCPLVLYGAGQVAIGRPFFEAVGNFRIVHYDR